MNVFKRAKEAVMNFFGMNNKKGADGLKVNNTAKIVKEPNSMSRVRGSKWDGWKGYTPKQIKELGRTAWMRGGTGSWAKTAKAGTPSFQ